MSREALTHIRGATITFAFIGGIMLASSENDILGCALGVLLTLAALALNMCANPKENPRYQESSNEVSR
jgi:hypothetical protein